MSEQPVFAKVDALERVDQDLELFFELIDMFSEDLESQLTSLQSAIEEQNADRLEKESHSIKSALGNLGAMSSYELSYELERAGKEFQSDDIEFSSEKASKVLSSLRQNIELFLAEVAEFRTSSQ